MTSWLARWRDEVGETYLLGMARAGLGLLFCLDTLQALRERSRHGHFADTFFLTSVPSSLVPSSSADAILLGVEMVCGLLALVGWMAQPALLLASLLGVFSLLANRLEFHNNRYALCCYCFLVALAPCDRSFSLRSRRLQPPGAPGPLWAQRMTQLQVSLVYLASGGSKLLDPDWRSGIVLGDRWARIAARDHLAINAHLAPALRQLLTFVARPLVASTVSKLAIATELSLVVGLWLPRTRVVALWVGLWLHLGIEVAADVQLFSWITLTVYLLFVTPTTGTRQLYFEPTADGSRPRSARLVAALDWFARWTIAPRPDSIAPPSPGSSLVVVDRDGAVGRGRDVTVALFRTLPALFALWLPVAAAARVLGRREPAVTPSA